MIYISLYITLKYPDKGDFFSASIAGVGVGFGGSVHVHGFSAIEVGFKVVDVELASVVKILSGKKCSS